MKDKYIVEILQYDELPEDVLKDFFTPDEKDCYSYIVAKHDGVVILFENDQMEPEDVSFYRDLSWIPYSLLDAYNLGKEDAEDNNKELEKFKRYLKLRDTWCHCDDDYNEVCSNPFENVWRNNELYRDVPKEEVEKWVSEANAELAELKELQEWYDDNYGKWSTEEDEDE